MKDIMNRRAHSRHVARQVKESRKEPTMEEVMRTLLEMTQSEENRRKLRYWRYCYMQVAFCAESGAGRPPIWQLFLTPWR